MSSMTPSYGLLHLHFSFLSNFAKRTFTVNDQVKIIGDFLTVSMHYTCEWVKFVTSIVIVYLKSNERVRRVAQLFGRRVRQCDGGYGKACHEPPIRLVSVGIFFIDETLRPR